MKHINKVFEWLSRITGYVQNGYSLQQNSRIPYGRIAKKMYAAMKDNCDEIGRRVLLPNIFHLYLSPEDYKARKSVEAVLISELKEELAVWAHEWDPEAVAELFSVYLEIDNELDPGDCYVNCEFQESGHLRNGKLSGPVATLVEEIREEQSHGSRSTKSDDFPEPVKKQEKIFVPLIEGSYEEKNCEPWRPWKERKARCMVIIEGPGRKDSQVVPEGRWYIGRGKACEVLLNSPDKKISRRHVEADVQADAIRIRGLGLNGALLNDRGLSSEEWIPVKPGDCLYIGSYKIRWSMMRMTK